MHVIGTTWCVPGARRVLVMWPPEGGPALGGGRVAVRSQPQHRGPVSQELPAGGPGAPPWPGAPGPWVGVVSEQMWVFGRAFVRAQFWELGT